MFVSCPSKLDCFPRVFDFRQSNNPFYEISASLKHNLYLLPDGKSTVPGECYFLYLPGDIFEFSFNPQCKIGWPPAHLDNMCRRSQSIN